MKVAIAISYLGTYDSKFVTCREAAKTGVGPDLAFGPSKCLLTSIAIPFSHSPVF
jgi:hypothetical protein